MASTSTSTGDITIIGAADNAHVENLTVIGRQYNTLTSKVDIDEIQKQTRDNIDLWTQDTVEPAFLSKVLEKIRIGSACVTITGSPGEGKSTLGYWVLRSLKDTRNVYEVDSLEQFKEVIKMGAPVILLDDIFGQTVFNQGLWQQWKKSIEQFMDMNEKKPPNEFGNLILIARDFVLNSGSRNAENPWKMLVNSEHVVNISRGVVRGNAEKENILISIAKKYEVPLDSTTITTICSIKTPHGFPHSCKLFVTLFKKDSTISAVDFFNKPLEFLHESLKILITNEVIEHIFIEMIEGDGHVVKSELESKFIRTAKDLCPTYIKPAGNGYDFDHPSVLDTVALLLCETKLSFILERFSMEFIRERVWLETTDGATREETGPGSKLMAEIPWNEAEELAKRFVTEIAAGDLRDVMHHNAWKSDKFVMLMLQHLTVEQVNVRDRRQVRGVAVVGGVLSECVTLLHKLCEENRADLVKMCLQRGAVVNSQEWSGFTPLHIVAWYGNTESVRVLLEFGANVNSTHRYGGTALDAATQLGRIETASVLRAAGGRSKHR